MKKIFQYFKENKLVAGGVLLILISLISFMATGAYQQRGLFVGGFAITYVLSGVYLFIISIHNFEYYGWRWSQGRAEPTVLLLVLWFISAFALNREMNVFDESVPWLVVWIVLSTAALLLAVQYRHLNGALKYLTFFLLGGALLLFVYYAFYLLPLYVISIIGILAIGISLHTYVPMCMAIITVSIIVKAYRLDKRTLYYALAGFLLPLATGIAFIIAWGNTNREIDLIINQNSLNEGKLPNWIVVSRQLSKSTMAERILKAGLLYHEVSPTGSFFYGDIPSRSFDGRKQHDPLVVIATLFHRKANLDEAERINILKSIYNSRHQAQERLWSGEHLETVSIISNIKLLPEYRMAYTEKTLMVHNNSSYQWDDEEAIYTFHLQEGSVASSLSLWIDGKEAKSRLTTKAKADSAYKQVVGVEVRDPSVVHWQEGNTISVRVFPCNTKENRKFRIGITSPLRKVGDKLVYENPYFDGPAATSALETLQLSFSNAPANLKMPGEFKQTAPDVYTTDHTYTANWQISCDAPKLATVPFAFGGNTYQLKDYQQVTEAFRPASIYLDVNSAWSKEEFDRLCKAAAEKPVYVYYDKLIRLSEKNKDNLFDLLSKQNFSLFPVNEIGNADNALLVTKSDNASPNLNDLEGTGFADALTTYLKVPRHIRLYNIGQELTPYLKALKEMRVFNYADGTPEELTSLLSKQQFVADQENDSTVVLDNAGIIIQRIVGEPNGPAPDHLLRLFAYNDIMKKVSPNYFNNDFIQPAILAEANQAYIVSPVSSLIVLETQKDYDRFGIEENKDSLKNASMTSSGAVPEPQEWMLIILASAVVIYLLTKQRLTTFKA